MEKRSTAQKLAWVQIKLNRLAHQYARTRMLERKQDTRQKIQWGGLVKKAGLSDLTTAILYGLLLDSAEKLASKNREEFKLACKLKGERALDNEAH
jgi:hypothetical protein